MKHKDKYYKIGLISLVFVLITLTEISTATTTVNNVTSLNGSMVNDDGTLSIITNHTIDNGLVGYWGFNGNVGTNAYNQNNMNGTVNTTNKGTLINMNPGLNNCTGNCSGWNSSGRIGNALRFDGVNDHVQLPYLGNFSSFTIDGWVGVYGDSLSGTTGFNTFTGNSSTNRILYHIASGKMLSQMGAGNHFSTREFPLSQRNHISYVYNHTITTAKWYINGNPDSELVGAISFIQPTKIGAFDVVNYMMNGIIDEVRIYNRVLSAEEIAVIHNTSLRTQAMPVISNQTALEYNIINRTRIVYSGHDSINNASIYARQNGTTSWALVQSNTTNNTWYPIMNTFNSMDFGIFITGNGSLTPFLTSLEWDERPNVSASVVDQSFWDYQNTSVIFSVNNSNLCLGTMNGTTISSCISPHNFGLMAPGSYTYMLNVTNTTSDFWVNVTATIIIYDNFISQWNGYTNNANTSFYNSPVNMLITYQINLNNETNVSCVWYVDGVVVPGSTKTNTIALNTLGNHTIIVSATMATSSGNVSWAATWDVGVLDGWASVLDALNEIKAKQIDQDNRIGQAGVMGFVGGIIGGAMVIGVLRRRKRA